MRDIKFRAWHKDIKEMFEVGQITLKKGIWDYQPEDRKYIGMSIPYQPSFILMQYTGLHDKNGKEIYEGDIVKVTYKNETEIFEVRYDEENTCFRMYYEDLKFLDFAIEEVDLYEVIGNIYDNPELLGGE